MKKEAEFNYLLILISTTMARQKGHVKYVGTIGDIRHFKIKGQKGYFAGLTGGPTGEQVATAPAFERTRENMNEFGGSAKAGRSIRSVFSAVLGKMSDSQLTGRLTAIMKKINLEDQSEPRGYRAILISEQRKYLSGIIFNKNANFDFCFKAGADLQKSVKRGAADYSVAAFNPMDAILAPAGANHFRLIFALGVVSDFAYTATSDTYEALKPDFHELSAITYSDYLNLKAPVPETVLNADVIKAEPVPDDCTIIAVVGIEFFQQVNENYYAFASGNAMKVIEAY
jgi:hypothetical protein